MYKTLDTEPFVYDSEWHLISIFLMKNFSEISHAHHKLINPIR